MTHGPPPPGQVPFHGAPGFHAYPPAGEPPKSYTAFNILGIFGCFGMTSVIGIIGLVFALQVSSKWHIGDYAGAESAANTAKILGIIGLCCFVASALAVVLYVALVFTGVILAVAG
ncbi:CD225/dispanin family protein [Nocardiopsis sp. NPDC006938]|uniref:CD225/dispanin family protein n=1 Tax=Nocardiopsis sp. NPDC006938 TaxID=3364337 RepID=UPI0036C64E1F